MTPTDMSGQAILSDEHHGTNVTTNALLVRVKLPMLFQRGGAIERLTAHIALERAKLHVLMHVRSTMTCRFEGAPTTGKPALVRPLARVCPFVYLKTGTCNQDKLCCRARNII